MSRIFLSYSKEDLAQALAIRNWMTAHGWNELFLDLDPERGVVAGQRWQEALKRAAERCELIVFLVSAHWAQSRWCLAEYLFAKNLNKPIFAVVVGPTAFSELPTELTNEWQVTNLVVGSCDYRDIVALPDGKMVEVSFCGEGLERLRIGLAQSGIDPKYFEWPPFHDPNRPPYRGLLPLEADDAGIFFGREAAVVDALDRLRGLRDKLPPRLLVILGASGAGKSSLLRAGVLPRLARENHRFVVAPVIRPERSVLWGDTGLLRSLEELFRREGHPVARADLRIAIDQGRHALVPLLDMLTSRSLYAGSGTGAPRTLVIPIDQGEELFTSEGQQEANRFLQLIRNMVSDENLAVIALFTIRSDSYERLQTEAELQGVYQQTLSLPPLPRGAFAEVIKGPARRLDQTRRAIRLDDAMIDALLADIEAGIAKDALPLLAFSLERLYGEYGATGHLRLDHYRKLGGIKGSIEAAVDRALQAGDKDGRIPKDRKARLALLRRGLIPWLADIDPDTGAPRRRVARQSEIPKESRLLINLLTEQRLLSTDVTLDSNEVTIEPAHEALLRQWSLLKDWLAEDAPLLSVLDSIESASKDWAKNGKTTAWLMHTGDRTHLIEQLESRPDLLSKLKETETKYFLTCQSIEKANRARARTRKTLAGAAVTIAGLLLVGFGVGAGYERLRLLPFFWDITLTARSDRSLKPGGAPFKDCVSCPEMVVVPAGTLKMTFEGDRSGRSIDIGHPFAVGRFEITFDEWDACVAYRGCESEPSDMTWGRGRRPVVNVSWKDAKHYTDWISKLTGKSYRLLSEAQWEYAASAGSVSKFPWGDQVGHNLANCKGCGSKWDDTETAPVGSFPANEFGLYDMQGNVWEWVEDGWHERLGEGLPQDGSPWTNGGDESRRVLRGGSFLTEPDGISSSNRSGDPSDQPDRALGFRVARAVDG